MPAFFEKRRPVVVSFSGIDGAGKSTQIEALAARAREAGLRVRVVPFWDEVATFTKVRETSGHAIFGGDKGVGRPDAPIERRDKNVQSWMMSCIRLLLYSTDALSLRSKFRAAMRSGEDLIIFDRYAYDELANLKLSRPLWRMYARLMMKVAPRPGISYLIDADPVQARARKPEYPLDFLHRCRESYLTLNRLIGGMTIIPPMPLEQARQQVLEHAIQVLPEISFGEVGRKISEGFADQDAAARSRVLMRAGITIDRW